MSPSPSLTRPPPTSSVSPGRLNVLANVVRKPMRQIFSEFSGKPAEAGADEYTGSGDVKYHLGTSYNRPTSSGKMVALSLMANPRCACLGAGAGARARGGGQGKGYGRLAGRSFSCEFQG